ncbi:MAG: helix-turn-helix domain-containing protein [Gammaproteobacteria bacterium]|nr:helix-turn-helix domain-containing protein [Gammaproteobacteria bacterium]
MPAPNAAPHPTPAPAPPGPGRSLGQARTDLGLSREDVARQLHLKPQHIVALEDDDYQSLPGATYVRGYLRSYAQLLGLSPEPILEAHARMIGGQQPAVLPSLSPPPQATSSHRHIRLTTYLVAAIVFGLALVWWQGGKPPPTPEIGRLDTRAPAPTGELMGPPGPLPDAAPAAPLTSADHAYMNTPAPLRGADPIVQPAAPANPPSPAPVGAAPVRAQLSLYVEQESWIEVRDGQQNRLLYESFPAGRTMMLEGIAPLYVFLGNADGVRVEFNGKPFDLAPHKRGQVARFALGAGAPAGAPR